MLTKQEMKSCGNVVCLSVKNLSEKYRDLKFREPHIIDQAWQM